MFFVCIFKQINKISFKEKEKNDNVDWKKLYRKLLKMDKQVTRKNNSMNEKSTKKKEDIKDN